MNLEHSSNSNHKSWSHIWHGSSYKLTQPRQSCRRSWHRTALSPAQTAAGWWIPHDSRQKILFSLKYCLTVGHRDRADLRSHQAGAVYSLSHSYYGEADNQNTKHLCLVATVEAGFQNCKAATFCHVFFFFIIISFIQTDTKNELIAGYLHISSFLTLVSCSIVLLVCKLHLQPTVHPAAWTHVVIACLYAEMEGDICIVNGQLAQKLPCQNTCQNSHILTKYKTSTTPPLQYRTVTGRWLHPILARLLLCLDRNAIKTTVAMQWCDQQWCDQHLVLPTWKDHTVNAVQPGEPHASLCCCNYCVSVWHERLSIHLCQLSGAARAHLPVGAHGLVGVPAVSQRALPAGGVRHAGVLVIALPLAYVEPKDPVLREDFPWLAHLGGDCQIE